MTSIASSPASTHSDAAIGVFDSGVGGLSILRHIHARLPDESLMYFADSAFSPYGGKPEQVIVERSLAIADFLLKAGAKALVVACNTATAAAIAALRARYPGLPIVGVEPGLKPAALLSKNNTVGVLATERTLASAKFNALHEQISATTGVQFFLQACIGLADRIETGELDSPVTRNLVERYLAPLIEQDIDTLVLGCTHYPFVQPLIEDIIGSHAKKPVAIVDTGEAVARQLARLLSEQNLLRQAGTRGANPIAAFTSGAQPALAAAFLSLLRLSPTVTGVEPGQ